MHAGKYPEGVPPMGHDAWGGGESAIGGAKERIMEKVQHVSGV